MFGKLRSLPRGHGGVGQSRNALRPGSQWGPVTGTQNEKVRVRHYICFIQSRLPREKRRVLPDGSGQELTRGTRRADLPAPPRAVGCAANAVGPPHKSHSQRPSNGLLPVREAP